MILYGNSFSPFVRKVMAYASEKGIALDFERDTMSRPPEFMRASPFGKMPGFTDGAFAISDSSAIITYLEAKFPTPSLLPADPASRARVVWYEEFADTIMSQVVFKCFWNRVVMPKFMKQEGDEAAAVEGETIILPPILGYLETVVPAPGAFLVGDALTIADLSVATMFVNYHHARAAFNPAHYPKTVAWVASIHARPSFAAVIAKESTMLAGL